MRALETSHSLSLTTGRLSGRMRRWVLSCLTQHLRYPDFPFRCLKLRSWGWYTKEDFFTGTWPCQHWDCRGVKLPWCTSYPGRVCQNHPVRTISTGRNPADLDVVEPWPAASSRLDSVISCHPLLSPPLPVLIYWFVNTSSRLIKENFIARLNSSATDDCVH